VAQGGHLVSEDVVARRFESGRQLFLELYRDLVDEWEVLDGNVSPPEIIASGGLGVSELVDLPEKWKDFSTP